MDVNFNDHETNADTTAPGQVDAGDDVSMPLGVDGEGDVDLMLGDDGSRKKLNSGALLIVVVAVIAAVGLFSMRTLTRASAEGGAPEHIEASIDEFLGVYERGGTASREGVLDVLTESYASRQVPLDAVQRDPFVLFEQGAANVPVTTAGNDPFGGRRRARQIQFESAAEKLRVGMILTGSTPMANVNNKVVRVGDMVLVDETGVEFRVVAIEADRVDFVVEDPDLEIKVEKSVSLRRN